MQSVNFALLNFYNLEKSKDIFDENMVEPLLTLFRDKFKLDACFIALVIDDTYELVIGKNSVKEDSQHFVRIYNLGKEGYERLFINYDEDLICNHANSILEGESILHYGVFRDEKTLDGIVGFADFHNKNRVWTKEEKESLIKLGRTLRLAVLYEKVKIQSKQQISRLRNEFQDQINIITSATSDYSSIFLIDYDTLVQTLYYTNGRYKAILDVALRELYYPKSATLAIYASVYKDDRKRVLEAADINNVKARLAADGIYTINYRRYIDDELDYAAFRYTLITLDNKKIIVLSIKEIGEPSDNNLQESNYDSLTGLFTKEEFIKRSNEKISLIKDVTKLHMIAFDVDRITQYNSYFGMASGNVLLKHISSTLMTLSEKMDIIYCRLGADRFALLASGSMKEIEDLINEIKSNVKFFNPKFFINLSFGICNVTDKLTPVGALIDRALSSIKLVKYKYDTLYSLYNEEIIKQRKNERHILDNMEEALKNHKIVPYYQPIYDVNGKNVASYEVLARWIDDNKPIEISNFMEVFINTGYIYHMDVIVWEDSIKFLKEKINNKENISLNINICDEYIGYNQLAETLTKLIKRYNVPADLINIEINEKLLLENKKDAYEIIKKLRDAGFKIIIDNFKAAISLLNKSLFDYIKIDLQRFNLDNENDKIILKSILDLTNELNVNVIASKIENKKEDAFVKENNIKIVQGFYYKKPLSEKEVNEL